jgi:mannose-6-phosphate isomerase-like protein (cupin superfamily)
VSVTDGTGASIQGVGVSATGPVDREGRTLGDGTLKLSGLRAGTYRIRFTREGFFTFEKEISWRAGQPAPEAIVTLTAAPPPPEPPPPPPPAPAPAAPKLPPPGKPTTMQLIDYFERNQISSKEQHKENIVGCSGVGQGMLWQVSDRWEGLQHDSADAMFYVMAGEGRLTLGGNEQNISAGSFAVVPRETKYSLMRRGRNPLVIVAFLAGAPCATN